ncbi:MAG TPA: major capsid family protein, partial [Candidatus Sulfotelmatobacter sp.]|nr:major capsid family protein [Candidatus Sulfotelmatobacter sp.]
MPPLILSNTGKPIKYPLLNSEGKPILLDRRLQEQCDMIEASCLQKAKEFGLVNAIGSGGAAGMDIPITTMTTIIKEKSEQKFYKLLGFSVSDFIPIKVGGEGAWSDYLLTYLVQQFMGNFETGIIDMGSPNVRLAEVSTGVKGVPVPTYLWAKSIGWTIPQVNAAARAGNWDLVSSLEEAIKTDFDLGVQRWAFLGGRGLNGTSGQAFGLLNQPGITENTTLITQPISSMNTTQFQEFIQALPNLFLANNNYTQPFTHFVIPASDYFGMAAPLSPTFPVVSFGEYLEKALKAAVPGFQKVLPLAYSQADKNSDVFGGDGKNVYAAYNFDPKTLRMDVPVPYSFTVPNTINGFHMQSVSYGQLTGLKA